MNTSSDPRWYINEHINEAYSDAENWRLAQEAKEPQGQRSGNPARLRWISALSALLKRGQRPYQPHIASSLSPLLYGTERKAS